jgi:hypothetical protein
MGLVGSFKRAHHERKDSTVVYGECKEDADCEEDTDHEEDHRRCAALLAK